MIDINKAKQKILDLAIRGKLTKQLKSDGNAADLLVEIQKVKEKQNTGARKTRPYSVGASYASPNVNDDLEMPFEIPENWVWCRFDELYDINPEVIANKNDKAAFIPMEKIGAGYENKFDYIIQDWEAASKAHTKFCDGDVCFAKISPCFENRKSFIANNLPNGIGGGTTELIVIRQNKVLKEFTYLIVLDERFILECSKSYKGVVGQQRIKRDILDNYLISLPPLAEQKRIVEKVEQLFDILDKIDEAQKKYQKDKEILKSKIIEAGIRGKLTKQLKSDGDAKDLFIEIQKEKEKLIKEKKIRNDKNIISEELDEPFEIPKNWRWCKIGEIGVYKKGPFGSLLRKSLFVEKSKDTIKVYEQQNAIRHDSHLGQYYISKEYFENKMKGFEVFGGDIIVSCAGTIGEIYLMPKCIEKGIINQALMKITLLKGIDKKYFINYFDLSLKKLAGNGNGSAMINIPPFEVLKNYTFPLPPLAEQERIVEVIEKILCIINDK